MRLTRRKITLQLTPLLDLMLIVFFLQYLELRERETRTTATVVAAEQDVSRLQEELRASRELAADSLRQVNELQSEITHLESTASSLRSQATTERSRLDDVLKREEALGRLVADFFGVSQEAVDSTLGAGKTPQEIAELRARFQQMASAESPRMLRQLLVHEEIRKRADVWDLSIDAQHVATLETGSRTNRLRLHLNANGEPDLPRFEEEFFQLYKSLPEPKSLVIILLTYDRDTRLIVTEAIADALPRITRRLADDARGKIRFEYADLGIRIGT